MHLSPLQSRFAASALASCLLILLYLSLFSPHFAIALELESISPALSDHDLDISPNLAARSPLSPSYEPSFVPFDRSIIGRAPEGFETLTNNEPFELNIDEGSTIRFVFPLSGVLNRESQDHKLELRDEKDLLEVDDAPEDVETAGVASKLESRQSSKRIYISANTCEQPRPVDPSKTTSSPPQLTLFVSKSADNMAPGLFTDQSQQWMFEFNEGAVMWNFSANHDVYISVHAPNVSDNYSGSYNFKIAVSTDRPYFSYKARDEDDLVWVDSDSQGALLYTHPLTDTNDPAVQEKALSSQPYVLFAHNQNDTSINGLKFSYCGLQNRAQIALSSGRGTNMVKTSMTTRGEEGFVRQQFFFEALNSSTKYWAILARDGSSSSGKRQNPVGGGGEVFNATIFKTKSNHSNCALITDLEFCNEVAYSVPYNPNTELTKTPRDLAVWYDTFAKINYENFNKSLSQIQCEAGSSQRYSLVRNCNDCARAYKNWLCTVAIPRCEDFDSNATWLQPRAVFQPFPNGERLSEEVLASLKIYENTTSYNRSRNARIDEIIKPGPHKELLPCDWLCYDLVRNCPASLGFGCPQPDGIGFEGNYGQMPREAGKQPTCNFQGAAHTLSGAPPGLLNEAWGLRSWLILGSAVLVLMV
ncbi:stretch-activated Ca2+-permeable channel component-domain-containing protein [Cladorrhinum sp. PSN259]|nr:stretch-activated Ca2+-permeable channel component-domain-containing protein [Cladorrhinum sp. PSN259]